MTDHIIPVLEKIGLPVLILVFMFWLVCYMARHITTLWHLYEQKQRRTHEDFTDALRRQEETHKRQIHEIQEGINIAIARNERANIRINENLTVNINPQIETAESPAFGETRILRIKPGGTITWGGYIFRDARLINHENQPASCTWPSRKVEHYPTIRVVVFNWLECFIEGVQPETTEAEQAARNAGHKTPLAPSEIPLNETLPDAEEFPSAVVNLDRILERGNYE